MRIMRYYYCFVISVSDIDTDLGRRQGNTVNAFKRY